MCSTNYQTRKKPTLNHHQHQTRSYTHARAYICTKKTFLASSVIFNTHSIFIVVKAEWKKLSSCLCYHNTGTNTREIQKTFKILSLTVSLLHILPISISLRLVRHKCHATEVNTESSPEVDTQTPYSRVSQITVYRLMYSECF